MRELLFLYLIAAVSCDSNTPKLGIVSDEDAQSSCSDLVRACSEPSDLSKNCTELHAGDDLQGELHLTLLDGYLRIRRDLLVLKSKAPLPAVEFDHSGVCVNDDACFFWVSTSSCAEGPCWHVVVRAIYPALPYVEHCKLNDTFKFRIDIGCSEELGFSYLIKFIPASCQ